MYANALTQSSAKFCKKSKLTVATQEKVSFLLDSGHSCSPLRTFKVVISQSQAVLSTPDEKGRHHNLHLFNLLNNFIRQCKRERSGFHVT